MEHRSPALLRFLAGIVRSQHAQASPSVPHRGLQLGHCHQRGAHQPPRRLTREYFSILSHLLLPTSGHGTMEATLPPQLFFSLSPPNVPDWAQTIQVHPIPNLTGNSAEEDAIIFLAYMVNESAASLSPWDGDSATTPPASTMTSDQQQVFFPRSSTGSIRHLHQSYQRSSQLQQHWHWDQIHRNYASLLPTHRCRYGCPRPYVTPLKCLLRQSTHLLAPCSQIGSFRSNKIAALSSSGSAFLQSPPQPQPTPS